MRGDLYFSSSNFHMSKWVSPMPEMVDLPDTSPGMLIKSIKWHAIMYWVDNVAYMYLWIICRGTKVSFELMVVNDVIGYYFYQ